MFCLYVSIWLCWDNTKFSWGRIIFKLIYAGVWTGETRLYFFKLKYFQQNVNNSDDLSQRTSVTYRIRRTRWSDNLAASFKYDSRYNYCHFRWRDGRDQTRRRVY